MLSAGLNPVPNDTLVAIKRHNMPHQTAAAKDVARHKTPETPPKVQTILYIFVKRYCLVSKPARQKAGKLFPQE